MEKYMKLLDQIKYTLETELDEDVYNEIFLSINKILKVQSSLIYLIVPNEFIKRRIELLYIKKLNTLAKSYFSEEVLQFKLITEERATQELQSNNSIPIIKDDEKSIQIKNTNLNGSYTFENFVIGNSNRFAYTSSLKASDQPGTFANPLYIFGDVGLGKTHLMHAIGNYLLESNPESKILYVKTEQFVEEYVRSSMKKSFTAFNAKYDNIDVLLVDDIQFLSTKEKSQIEFFKLFELLHGKQKQIVITSDKQASELKDIMKRLTSRFQWGLTSDINRPDLDHRIKILDKKLSSETTNPELIPHEVIEFIASVFDNSIRELEGGLKRVFFYCTSYNVDFTKENAEKALDIYLKPKETSDNVLTQTKINTIMSVICDYYHITHTDILSKKRKREILLPRQVAMYIIKTKYDVTYKKIGLLFNGKDHSTVMHSVEKIRNEIVMDKSIENDVNKLLIKCGN